MFNLFAIKPRSFDDFVELLRTQAATKVSGYSERKPVGLTRFFGPSSSIGIGDWQEIIILESKTKSGRKILYIEELGEYVGSLGGFADAEKRLDTTITCLITVWDRLDKIKNLLPFINCEFHGGAGIMNEGSKRQLFLEAEAHNLVPLPLNRNS